MVVARSSVSYICHLRVVASTSVLAEGGHAWQGSRRWCRGGGGSPPVGPEPAAAERVREGRWNRPLRRVAY